MKNFYFISLVLLIGIVAESRILDGKNYLNKNTETHIDKSKEDMLRDLHGRIHRYLKDKRNDESAFVKLFDVQPKVKDFLRILKKISNEYMSATRVTLDRNHVLIDSMLKQAQIHLKKKLKSDSPHLQFLLDTYFDQIIKQLKENQRQSINQIEHSYFTEFELINRQTEKPTYDNTTHLKTLNNILGKIVDMTNSHIRSDLIKEQKILKETIQILKEAVMNKFKKFKNLEAKIETEFLLINVQLTKLNDQCLKDLDEIMSRRKQILLVELGSINNSIDFEHGKLMDGIMEKCNSEPRYIEKCQRWGLIDTAQKDSKLIQNYQSVQQDQMASHQSQKEPNEHLSRTSPKYQISPKKLEYLHEDNYSEIKKVDKEEPRPKLAEAYYAKMNPIQKTRDGFKMAEQPWSVQNEKRPTSNELRKYVKADQPKSIKKLEKYFGRMSPRDFLKLSEFNFGRRDHQRIQNVQQNLEPIFQSKEFQDDRISTTTTTITTTISTMTTSTITETTTTTTSTTTTTTTTTTSSTESINFEDIVSITELADLEETTTIQNIEMASTSTAISLPNEVLQVQLSTESLVETTQSTEKNEVESVLKIENSNKKNKTRTRDQAQKLSLIFNKNSDLFDIDEKNDEDDHDNDHDYEEYEVKILNEKIQSLNANSPVIIQGQEIKNEISPIQNVKRLRISLFDEEPEPKGPNFYLNENYVCIKLSPNALREIQGPSF